MKCFRARTTCTEKKVTLLVCERVTEEAFVAFLFVSLIRCTFELLLLLFCGEAKQADLIAAIWCHDHSMPWANETERMRNDAEPK